MVFDKDESEATIKEVNDNQFELRKQSKCESHKKMEGSVFIADKQI